VKVQCVQCKEVVALGKFRIEGEAIEISCPECGAHYRISAETGERAGATRVEAKAAGDPCPKCGHDVAAGADACAVCGLLREKFADFAATRPDEPEAVATAWAACRERWDEPAAHDRFLEAVAAAKAFPAAARRYRDVLRETPGDERARRGVDRVTRMAEAALLGSPASARLAAKTPEPYKNVVLLLLILVCLGGIFGIYGLVRARNARDEQQQQDSGTIEKRQPDRKQRSTPARPR
jgi:hypothetical protein